VFLLTLSGLPPHMNLKHLLSISFLYLSGTFSWGKQNLTILGKIMIIKALVLPIFTFVVSACVVPDKYRKEIESFTVL
jgi:hypothetical protein